MPVEVLAGGGDIVFVLAEAGAVDRVEITGDDFAVLDQQRRLPAARI